MGRTFFGFGIFKSSGDGRPNEGRGLPSIEDSDVTREWMDKRSPTSHGVLGLDPGMAVDLDLHGEHRNATVVAEEGDQKTGRADVYVRSEGNRGSETHKITFEPDGARSMVQTDHPKKVRKAP